MNKFSKITGFGIYVPEKILTNNDLEKMVDTSDEWIIKRTGIKKRHISEIESNLDMSLKAVNKLCLNFKETVEDIDFIICATSTSEFVFPNMASQVQGSLNIKNCGAIDIYTGCAGFTYGITLASSLIRSGTHKKVLLITSEVLSRITDYTDRNTCVLFGDAATATLLEGCELAEEGVVATCTNSDGNQGINLYSGTSSKYLGGKEVINDGKTHQNGRAVYKWVTENIPSCIDDFLNKYHIKKEEIDWFVPHSANLRIIEKLCQELGIPLEKTLNSVEDFGNTSSCSIPLAIYENIGKLKCGDKLLLYGFGGGMVHAGIVLNWGIKSE